MPLQYDRSLFVILFIKKVLAFSSDHTNNWTRQSETWGCFQSLTYAEPYVLTKEKNKWSETLANDFLSGIGLILRRYSGRRVQNYTVQAYNSVLTTHLTEEYKKFYTTYITSNNLSHYPMYPIITFKQLISLNN